MIHSGILLGRETVALAITVGQLLKRGPLWVNCKVAPPYRGMHDAI